MDKDLLIKSRELKEKATQIINVTKVKEIFSKIGDVVFVGSYELDLMYRPDIDFAVISETPDKQKAIDITKELLDSKQFQTVGFADWVSHKNTLDKKGYYWELVYAEGDIFWKFDIWYSQIANDDSIGPTQRFKKELQLNTSAKEIILRLKDEFFDGTKYRNNVNGYKLYTAVLEHGVINSEGLIKFVESL